MAPTLVFLHFLVTFEKNPAECVALVEATNDEEEEKLHALTEECDKGILDLSTVGTGRETRRRRLAMNREKMVSEAFVKVAKAVMLKWKTSDYEVPGYGKIEVVFHVSCQHILRTYLNR